MTKFQERYQARAETIACKQIGCSRHGSWSYLPGDSNHAYCYRHIDWTKCCEGEYGLVYPRRLVNVTRKFKRLIRRAYGNEVPRYKTVRTYWYEDEGQLELWTDEHPQK